MSPVGGFTRSGRPPLSAAPVALRDPRAAAAEPHRLDAARDRLEPRRADRPQRGRLPRAQGRRRLRAGDDVRVGVGRPVDGGVVRLGRALGRAQRAGAPGAGRRRARARRARDVADDAHGPPRHVRHLGHPAARAVGPARGRAHGGAGAARDRRAAGHRRALRGGRPTARALRPRWRRGHVVRRAPDRAVLRSRWSTRAPTSTAAPWRTGPGSRGRC